MPTIIQFAIDRPAWPDDDERREQTLLTLAQLREDLRIPFGDTGHDELIADLAAEALSAVSADLNIPVLPEAGMVRVCVPSQTAVLTIPGDGDPFALEATAVRWAGDGALDGAPLTAAVLWPGESGIPQTSVLTPDTDPPLIAGNIAVNPPQGGWPALQLGLVYRRGLLQTDARLKALRALVTMRTRNLYDGIAAIPSIERSAFERIAAPIRNMAPRPDGYTPLGLTP